MKSNILQYTFIILTCILIANFSVAQEKKIDKKDLPKAVIDSFLKSYPKAKIKGASMEKEHGKVYYEIESMDGSQRRDLLYTKSGKVAEIEETLLTNDIPGFVKNSVRKKYPKGEINRAEKVTSGKKISYELVVENGTQKHEVVLDSKGNIQKVKQNKSGEKEEKDND